MLRLRRDDCVETEEYALKSWYPIASLYCLCRRHRNYSQASQASQTNHVNQSNSTNHNPPTYRSNLTSAIGQHLIDTGHKPDFNASFSVIFRTDKWKLLRFAEAIAISRLKPELCIHKRLALNHRLNWI